MGRAAGLTFGLPGVTLLHQTAQTAPLAPLEPFVGRSLDGILGRESSGSWWWRSITPQRS